MTCVKLSNHKVTLIYCIDHPSVFYVNQATYTIVCCSLINALAVNSHTVFTFLVFTFGMPSKHDKFMMRCHHFLFNLIWRNYINDNIWTSTLLLLTLFWLALHFDKKSSILWWQLIVSSPCWSPFISHPFRDVNPLTAYSSSVPYTSTCDCLLPFPLTQISCYDPNNRPTQF